jgi:hypothetical protein
MRTRRIEISLEDAWADTVREPERRVNGRDGDGAAYGNPYTTTWLADDPPGQIGDFMPAATPMRCFPPAR